MNSSIDRVEPLPGRTTPPSSPLAERMQVGVGFNLLGAAFNQGSTLAVNIVVANLVGQEAFGRYTMVLATIATVATIGQLSMGYTATKHLAEFRSVDPSRASRMLGLFTGVSIVSALIAGLTLAATASWLASTILDAPDLAPMLRLAAAAVFFTVLNGFSSGALAGLERYAALAKVGVVSGTLYAIICIVLARAFGLIGAVAGVATSAFVQSVILGIVLVGEAARQGMTITGRGIWQERAILSAFALPASLTGLVSLPALWISSALLARQPDGYHQLALFGAANSFRTMVLFLPQAINNVGMSLLNNQRRSSTEGYAKVFWMNAGWTAGSALGTAGLLFLASGSLLSLFGTNFTAGRAALGILLGAAIVEAVANAAYQIVVSRGRMWASLLVVSLPRDLSLVLLAAALTPTLGAEGLAIAYAAAWVLALVGILSLVRQLGVSATPLVPARRGHALTVMTTALRLATGIYRATPFRPVREAYFRSFLRLVRGRRVTRTIEGMTFELDLGELIDVSVFLQQYERDVVALIERLTRPGSTVLDIGANIGAHTLRFSKLVGSGGNVFAFEPMDYAFTKLARNVALNGAVNTQLVRLALSDHNAAAQVVGYRSSWTLTGERKHETAVVDFRRLDDWCNERGVTDVHLVKLDVDGDEQKVVAGGLSTIERCRPILLVEVGAWHFSSTEYNPLHLLATRGYRFWETTTLLEIDLPGIRARLPDRDDEMAFSINLVASVASLFDESADGRSR